LGKWSQAVPRGGLLNSAGPCDPGLRFEFRRTDGSPPFFGTASRKRLVDPLLVCDRVPGFAGLSGE